MSDFFVIFAGKKRVGFDPSTFRMIAGEFDQIESRFGMVEFVQLLCGLAREGDGIVIGMSAFVGVREHDVWLKLFEQRQNSVRKVFEFERNSLIDEVEVCDGVGGNAGEGHGSYRFVPAGPGIFFAGVTTYGERRRDSAANLP
jgi:hypothetical protein